MSSSLKDWVSDRLHNALGMNDSSVTEYLIKLTEVKSSVNGVIKELKDVITVDSEFEEFLSELWIKVRGDDKAASTSLSGHSKEKDKSNKKKRKKYRDEMEEAREAGPKLLKTERRPSDDEDGSMDPEERERIQDLRERDAFVSRLHGRESQRTRNVAETATERRAFEAAAERLRIEKQDRDKALPRMRVESRRKYLEKRKEDKLRELEGDVADDEFLFEDEQALTERERTERQYKKKVLSLARDYDKLGEEEKERRYAIPDEKSKSEKPQREDDPEERKAGYEQRKWEEDRMRGTSLSFGAKDKGSASKERPKQYNLVLEDEVAFIKSLPLAGTRPKKKKEGDSSSSESEDDSESVEEIKPEKKLSLDEVRRSLPVYPFRNALLKAIETHQVLIVEGETGSGKTTQIPQYLHEAGYTRDDKRVGCTQPRRVAAMSVASRVAQEMKRKLGNEVGYSIRFEDCTSVRTKIKYMTDGMLLREFLLDPTLATYNVMIVDEAHERTLHTDILFGLLKDVARFRPDLKLLISSATLDSAKFSDFFDEAPIFRIPGRRYPVHIYYTIAPEANYLDAAAVTALQIHVTQPLGDVLVFLTGQEEIEACQELLQERLRALGSRAREMVVLPIYANLPSEMQTRIFEPTPPGARKVVLATNIAETSLTIDGVQFVIDAGYAKQNYFNARAGMESLVVVPISRAAANQRAGRAGRVGPGKCFRLYTQWAFEHDMDEDTMPEIQRVNLGNVVLQLKSLGIHDLLNFDYVDPPPAETLILALEQLYALQALNHKGELTTVGRRMAELPVEPMMARMILAAEKNGAVEEVLTIAAMLSAGGAVFYRPKDKALHADTARKGFFHPDGDHLTLLNVFEHWQAAQFDEQWCRDNFVQPRSLRRARDVRDQLVALMERVEVQLSSANGDSIPVRKSICAGYFYHTARLGKGGVYRTAKKSRTVALHPQSCLAETVPRWVIYHEVVLTTKEYMRTATVVEPQWLTEAAPHYYREEELADATRKMPRGAGKAPD